MGDEAPGEKVVQGELFGCDGFSGVDAAERHVTGSEFPVPGLGGQGGSRGGGKEFVLQVGDRGVPPLHVVQPVPADKGSHDAGVIPEVGHPLGVQDDGSAVRAVHGKGFAVPGAGLIFLDCVLGPPAGGRTGSPL